MRIMPVCVCEGHNDCAGLKYKPSRLAVIHAKGLMKNAPRMYARQSLFYFHLTLPALPFKTDSWQPHGRLMARSGKLSLVTRQFRDPLALARLM